MPNRPKRNTNHLRLLQNDGVRGDHVLICEHCGARQRVALPVQIDLWLRMAKGFEKQHQNCRPPAA